MPISERTATRLNALMRPEPDIDHLAVARSILGAIADEPNDEARIAALAYVFDNWLFATLSGPLSPATAYQPAFDFEGRDAADYEVVRRDTTTQLRIVALLAQAAAERIDTVEVARRSWALIGKLPLVLTKSAALDRLIRGVATMPKPSVGEAQYNEPLPNDRFHSILWRNRTAFAAAADALSDHRLRTKGARGAAFLGALARIEDPEERANVAGTVIEWLPSTGSIITEMLATAIPLGGIGGLGEALAAALAGKPCPSFGKVHGRGEHEGE